MVKLMVCGAAGRMGKEILKAVSRSNIFTVTAAIERQGHPSIGKDAFTIAGLEPSGVIISDSVSNEIEKCDAVVDFSTPDGTSSLVNVLKHKPKVTVIGTTGLSSETIEKVRLVSLKVPVLVSSNLSRGVAVIKRIISNVQNLLPEFDIEIIEIHHRNKMDAPSGTAKNIIEVLSGKKERSVEYQSSVVFGRHGAEAKRKSGQIGVHSVRGGSVTGEHRILFMGEGERIEISHIAENRSIFASGALQAIEILMKKPPGLYNMDDVF